MYPICGILTYDPYSFPLTPCLHIQSKGQIISCPENKFCMHLCITSMLFVVAYYVSEYSYFVCTCLFPLQILLTRFDACLTHRLPAFVVRNPGPTSHPPSLTLPLRHDSRLLLGWTAVVRDRGTIKTVMVPRYFCLLLGS